MAKKSAVKKSVARKKSVVKKSPVKKAAKKKATAGKKASGKKTAARKSTGQKNAGRKKSAATAPTPFHELLKGERVCLAGTFKWYPSLKEVKEILRILGATLTKKVDDKLSILIVGEGRKPALQSQAEKLNAAGTAAIRIMADLKSLLPVDFDENLAYYILNHKSADDLSVILDRPILFPAYVAHVNGADFTKKTIGNSKYLSLTVKFSNCDFSKATFRNTSTRGQRDDSHERCLFDGTRFENANMWNYKESEFKNISGTKLHFFDLENSQIHKAKLDNFDSYYVRDCEITDAMFGRFGIRGSTSLGAFRKNVFRKVKLSEIDIESEMNQCEFDDVIFENSKLDEPLAFVKSTLRNVKFRKLAGSTIRFDNCQLVNCSFEENDIGLVDFGNSKVTNSRMKKNQFGVTQATKAQIDEISGLDSDAVKNLASYPLVKQLASTMEQSEKLEIRFDGTFGNEIVSFEAGVYYSREFTYRAKKDKKHQNTFRFPHSPKPKAKDIGTQILSMIRSSKIDELQLGSLKTKTSGCPLKPKQLKELVIGAVYQAIGEEPKSADELAAAAKEAKKKAADIKKEIIAELQSGAAKKLNRRTAEQLKAGSPYKKIDVSGAKLAGVKLKELDFGQSIFAGADLSKAQLQEARFLRASLVGCNFSGANLEFANFRNADLTDADLSNAKLRGIELQGAVLKNTIFSGANFDSNSKLYSTLETVLAGVDLSEANMKGAKIKRAIYDEKTRFPATVSAATIKKFEWAGSGLPPHERKQNVKASGPLDFDQFMDRLGEITDSSRLKKSTKMLKADAFQLFSEVSNGAVTGVVKSQTDAKLVYSCSLSSDGTFCCCTQNLNACGGLRGSLCKHLLVLILGLTKSGELDATDVDAWINASKMKQPELDKDRMSEILLKYKGAEAGEIDWRPTETVPEDFMAF